MSALFDHRVAAGAAQSALRHAVLCGAVGVALLMGRLATAAAAPGPSKLSEESPSTGSSSSDSTPPDLQPQPTAEVDASTILVPSALDDPVEPLAAARLAEVDDDRVRSAALFSVAQLAVRSGDHARALRLLQRAHRRDAESAYVLKQIVALAFQLERHSQAVRYALLAVEHEEDDAALLIRLARYVAQSGDPVRSIRLYERARRIAARGTASPVTVEIAGELGQLYYLAGESSGAAEQFATVCRAMEQPKEFGLSDGQAETLRASAPSAYQALGQSLLAADRPREAAEAFQRSHAARPDDAVLGYHLAAIAEKEGRAESGLVDLKKYLNARQSNLGRAPYELWIRLLDQCGRRDSAIGQLEEQVASDPENAVLQWFLADQYRDQRQFAAARRMYRRALQRTEPRGQLALWRGLVKLELASGDVQKLLAALGEAVGASGAWSSLHEDGLAIKENRPLANQLVDAALTRLSGSADLQHGGSSLAAAILAASLARHDDANRLFGSAYDALPEMGPVVLQTWGLSLVDAERRQAAAEVFARGADAERFPSHAMNFLLMISATKELDGQTEAAIETAEAAIRSAPASVQAASRVPAILYHAKRFDDAADAYQSLIARFDDRFDDDEIRDDLREARMALANVEVRRGRTSAAEEWLGQVLDEYPDDPGASNDLGYLWADSGKRLQQALRMIKIAVAAAPDNLAYRDSLGWVYHRLNRPSEAVAELRRAAASDEPDAAILDHLGDALNAAGQPLEAVDVWSRASTLLDSAGDAAQAEEIQDKIRVARAQSATP